MPRQHPRTTATTRASCVQLGRMLVGQLMATPAPVPAVRDRRGQQPDEAAASATPRSSLPVFLAPACEAFTRCHRLVKERGEPPPPGVTSPDSQARTQLMESAPNPCRRPDSQPKFSAGPGVKDRRRRPAKPAAEGRPLLREPLRTPSPKGSAAPADRRLSTTRNPMAARPRLLDCDP